MYILINITSLHKYSHHCIYSSIVTNPLSTCTLCLFHIVNIVYILINIIYIASLACIILSNIAWLVGEGGAYYCVSVCGFFDRSDVFPLLCHLLQLKFVLFLYDIQILFLLSIKYVSILFPPSIIATFAGLIQHVHK